MAHQKKSANPKKALTEITNLDPAKFKAYICMASIKPGATMPTYQRLPITEGATQEFVNYAIQLRDALKKAMLKGDIDLSDYDATHTMQQHLIEHINLDDFGIVQRQVQPLATISQMGEFTADNDFVNGLTFYVIVMQPVKAGRQIHFFRAFTQKNELAHSAKMGLMLTNTHYQRVRRPVLMFDKAIDAMQVGNSMLIIRNQNFEKMFNIFEIIKQNAINMADVLDEKNVMRMLGGKKADRNQLKKLIAKLDKTALKPYLKSMKSGDIHKMKKAFQLPISIGPERSTLDYDFKWILLNLFDDDYMEHSTSEIQYQEPTELPETPLMPETTTEQTQKSHMRTTGKSRRTKTKSNKIGKPRKKI